MPLGRPVTATRIPGMRRGTFRWRARDTDPCCARHACTRRVTLDETGITLERSLPAALLLSLRSTGRGFSRALRRAREVFACGAGILASLGVVSAVLRRPRRILACGAGMLASLEGILAPFGRSTDSCLRRWYSRFARGSLASLERVSAVLRRPRRILACGVVTLAPLDQTGILARPSARSEGRACGAVTLAPLDRTGILARPTARSRGLCLRRWYSRFAQGSLASLGVVSAVLRRPRRILACGAGMLASLEGILAPFGRSTDPCLRRWYSRFARG